jgi:hypothetical protein
LKTDLQQKLSQVIGVSAGSASMSHSRRIGHASGWKGVEGMEGVDSAGSTRSSSSGVGPAQRRPSVHAEAGEKSVEY